MAKDKVAVIDEVNAENTPVPEIETVTIKFTLNGVDLSIDVPANAEDYPYQAMIHMENERIMSAFDCILNEVDRNRLHSLRPTLKQFTDIIVPAWNKAQTGKED